MRMVAFASIITASIITANAASAQVTYTLPDAGVVITLTNYQQDVSVTVDGQTFTGSVAKTPVYKTGPYGPFFFGWEFKGDLSPSSSYDEIWERFCSGGRDYHCWLQQYQGTFTIQ